MMATVGNKLVSLSVAGLALFSTAVCFPAERRVDGFGTELGNGTGSNVFVSDGGNYVITTNTGIDITSLGFKEIFAPFFNQNHQRTSLKIIVAKASEILNFGDLAKKFSYKSDWKIGMIGKYHSIEKEAQVKEDHCMFDARIIKSPGEVTMISVDGGPDCRPGSDFDRAKSSLETFTLLE